MKLRETVGRWVKRRKSEGLRVVLKDLSEDLRSDAIPASLRQAAQTVAGLLDGKNEASEGSPPNAVIINISVAVAVGAPGKDQDADSGSGAPPPPNDALVIASAVATAPALPRPKKSAGEDADRAKAAKAGQPASREPKR